jgi:hypothetical protein
MRVPFVSKMNGAAYSERVILVVTLSLYLSP